MTEYWKSNARKYCDFCKCWIADNKISISYHEGGKKHKENVSRKLSELSKKSIKEHRSQLKEDAEMRKMEEAALAAYMKDIENNADITSQGINKTLEDTNSVLTLKTPTVAESSSTSEPQTEQTIVWLEVVSEDGSKYYWNTESRETTWDKPEKFLTVEEQEKSKKKELRKKKIQEDQTNKVKQEEQKKELDASLKREKMKAKRVPKSDDPPPKLFGPIAKPENPFGSWVPVITKPQEKIDLQLPNQSQNHNVVNVPLPKDDCERTFKEKKVTSLDDSLESSEFKKRKFGGNFKKHSRQRLDND